MAQVYQVVPLLDVDFRATSIEFTKDKVFIGESKGHIHSYTLARKGMPDETLVPYLNSIKPWRARVEKLKADTAIGVLYAFAEGNLSVFHLETLEDLQNFGKNFNIFAINEHKDFSGRVCIAQKRRLTTFRWGQSLKNSKGLLGGFIVDKDNFMVPDVPSTMAWCRHSICVGFTKKSYIIINSENGSTKEIDLPSGPINFQPYVKVIKDEFFCLWGTNLLISFYSSTGEPSARSTISFEESRHIISVGYQEPYVVILTERTLEVFSLEDSHCVQQESLPSGSGAVAMSDTDVPITYVTTSSVMSLKPIPIDSQITKMLLQCKIKEARILLEKHIDPTAEDSDLAFEQFNLDAAWCLFRNLKLELSVEHFLLTNFDPRDVMSLFPDYCNRNIYSQDNTRKETVATLVYSTCIERGASPDNTEFNKMIEEKTIRVKLYVISLLQQKRETVFKPPKAGRASGQQNFLVSKFSVNKINPQPLKRDECLELIDTFLLKLYIDIGLDRNSQKKLQEKFGKNHLRLLEDLFDSANQPKLNFPDCEAFLKSNGKGAQNALAMLYEAYNRKVDALRIWKELGGTKEAGLKEQAARQTVKILLQVNDKQTVFEYSTWVLSLFPDIGLEVFTSSEEQHRIPPDLVLQHLERFDKIEPPLSERYLKYLVEEKEIDAERFHTRLALCYVQKLFQMKPRDSDDEIPPQNTSTFMKYKKELMLFLETSKNYRPSTLLEELKDSWLLDAEVLLLSREKKYMEALHILVSHAIRKDDFDRAEKYCLSQSEQLLTKLLKIYIEKALNYEQQTNEISEPRLQEEAKKNMKKFQNCAENLLQKYATHEEMDPLLVLEIIPEHWELSSSALHTYLYVALSHTLHRGHDVGILNQLSEMNLIQTECEWTAKRNASVKITNERRCDVCRNKIGNRPFVVYPNGKVVHHSCMGASNICPVTKTNFESLA